MRIVVTGASGNVGTSLLLALGKSGEHELVGVSRRRPPSVRPYEWADWQQLDLGRPDAAERLTPVLEGADAVVHLAWLIQPSRNRELMRGVNRGGTEAVTDAVIAAGVPHFVHQSSLGAYGPGPKTPPVDESWPTTGIATSAYSRDKSAAEEIVTRAEAHTLVTRVRPSIIFNEAAASEVSRYFLGSLIPKLIVRRATTRLVPFPDAMRFQGVHADDVASAIVLMLEQRAGGAFNVAADPVIDREQFRRIFGGVAPEVPVKALRTLAAVTYRAHIQPTEPGWVDLAEQTPLMDTSRLRALGWTPRHDAADAFGRFIDAMGRGAGRPGPLLYRRRPGRPGPTR